MNEIWKDIAGYEGLYQVSNLGRVKSFYGRGRILKPGLGNGYFTVVLCRNGKQKSHAVHRLVALAFVSNPENKPEVNHDNGIKTDNRVENLKWATPSENIQHSYDTGLHPQGEDCSWANFTNEQVRYIRNNPDNLSIKQLAEVFGADEVTIGAIQLNKIYKKAGGRIRERLNRRVPKEIREQIRREYKPGVRGCGLRALAKKYNVTPPTILRIVRENQPEVVKSDDNSDVSN